ncbi:hypothetical protein [Streptosporangium sp. NPDC002721]|uniref:hypothetical protein n=1 Tax=Streptosporangium sp. NPDC002721 TaxID=3366188 RepID=UPI0036809242
MALTPTSWDPACGLTYAEWLRDKSVQARPDGWTHATHDQKRVYRSDKDGRLVEVKTDQLGNDTIRHGADQQSVRIRSVETVHATIPASEAPAFLPGPAA